MPRNGKNRGQGRGRGAEQPSPRGRGAGGSPYRGGPGRGRGRGTPAAAGSSFAEEELVFTAKMMSQGSVDVNSGPQNRGRGGTPRGYRGGRGGGGGTPQRSGANTPRGGGRGADFGSRGSGRGRGDRGFGIGASPRGGRGGAPSTPNYNNNSRFRPDVPLSGLLYAARPLLKPVIFVPSVLTKILFEEESKEDLLRAAVEDVDDTEQSHAPTADKVFRVFSGANLPPPSSSSSSENEEDRKEKEDSIEEIDFNDMGKLLESLATTTAASSSRVPQQEERVDRQEEVFTGYFVDTQAQGVDEDGDALLEVDFDDLGKLMEGTASLNVSNTVGEEREDVSMNKEMVVEATQESHKPSLPTSTSVHVSSSVNASTSSNQEEGTTHFDEVATQSEGVTMEEHIDLTTITHPATHPSASVSGELVSQQEESSFMRVDELVTAISSSSVSSNESTTREETSTATSEAELSEPAAKRLPGAADEGSQRGDGENDILAGEARPVTSSSVGIESMEGIYVPASSKSSATTDMDTTALEGTPTPAQEAPAASASTSSHATVAEYTQDLFFVDVNPDPVPGGSLPSQSLPDDSDEIIVYVAPHPRSKDMQEQEEHRTKEQDQPRTEDKDTSRFEPYLRGAGLPTTTTMSVDEFSFSFASTSTFITHQTTTTQIQTPVNAAKFKPNKRLRVPPVTTPRQAKLFKAKERRLKKRGGFGAYGAMMSEAQLFSGVKDPKMGLRRMDDSDLDWGDTSDEEDKEEGGEEGFMSFADAQKPTYTGKGKGKQRDMGVTGDADGMEVDELDVDAMKRFVGGLLGKDAGQFVTMDDIRDRERMRAEDEELEFGGSGSSGEEDGDEDEEVEEVFKAEEGLLISEPAGDDLEDESEDEEEDDDDDDDDDEQTPRTSFQARLERLREKSRGKRPADSSFDAGQSSDEDDDVLNRNMTWAEEDEDFLAEIQDILDENEDILKGRDRKERNKLFRAVRDGAFDYGLEEEGFNPAKRKKDKRKGLPEGLKEQWDKDRQKKAERKQARALERLAQAADPLSQKKGGDKGRKAMRVAASLDPTINVLPNRIIDMTTLVQQIRRFISDIGGPQSMSLPPTNKETRKNVHELALAFGLNSVSKGKGNARYTTLTKTTRSGWKIDEAKIAKIMRRSGGAGARGAEFVSRGGKGRGGNPGKVPRHKEGDEVGKAAPKISEGNIGFRMLAMMGWSEGELIGVSGGLEAPLTAIIKNTKLGLGATK